MKDNPEFVKTLLEIELVKPENFLIVKETLTRMGIGSVQKKELYQSCHILHKQKKYYIVHFKEMMILDGLESELSEEDIARRNLIAECLETWGLLKIIDPERFKPMGSINLRTISSDDKKNWKLIPKHRLGSTRNRPIEDSENPQT